MYGLNHRIGILFRENMQKKSYEMRYFFIDDAANMYYVVSLPRLQKTIRLNIDKAIKNQASGLNNQKKENKKAGPLIRFSGKSRSR